MRALLLLLLFFFSLCSGQCSTQLSRPCLSVVSGSGIGPAVCQNGLYRVDVATFSSSGVAAPCGPLFCGSEGWQILSQWFTTFGALVGSSYLPLSSCAGGVYSFNFSPSYEGLYSLTVLYNSSTLPVSCTCSNPAPAVGVVSSSCNTCNPPTPTCVSNQNRVPQYDVPNTIPGGDQIIFQYGGQGGIQ